MAETRCIELQLAGRDVTIELPADPERLLEEALAAENAGIRDADAYWGLLWDAAPRTAKLLLSREWPDHPTVLELGCGAGLTGVAALIAGMQVTFSDLVPAAVRLAQLNAGRNGFPQAKGLVIDWCHPPDLRFEMLLGSDVLYDVSNHVPLLNTMDVMLKEGGVVWIGDAGRSALPEFVRRAERSGWTVQLFDEQYRAVSAIMHLKFQLLVLSRS